MLYAQAVAESGVLPESMVRETIARALEGRFKGARLLVLIPDHTRTFPMPMLFRVLTGALRDAARLDFMVALGTHPPLNEAALYRLVGITPAERADAYRDVGLLNHEWNNPDALFTLGVITQDQVKQIAGDAWHPSLGGDVPVRVNRAAVEHDAILIVGPTFPHEVVGFSGGAKYLYPGISGPEMINTTHWMGALLTIPNTIGVERTPMRAMIHAAAAMIPTPATLLSLVIEGEGAAGVFAGDLHEAFHAAAQLSAMRHIAWVERPFRCVLSHAPAMYDELWVAGKAMYKLEPVVADGGELIIYAPHLDTVSATHGKHIHEVGYHVLDYFLAQWDRFRHIPLSVLAHSTHVKGVGTYEHGVERPRVTVTLASRIAEADTRRLNLNYRDPARIRVEDWQGREAEGVLYVPRAGEMLYRVRGEQGKLG